MWRQNWNPCAPTCVDTESNPMTDLNEASLLEAMRNIGWADERDLKLKPKPTRLVVTPEGIALVRYRYETEPEFCLAVQEHAAENPEYRKLCEDVGLVL